MRIQKFGRLRAVAAVVLAAGGLAAVSAAHPAAALADSCTPSANGFTWSTVSSSGGVTLCQGQQPNQGGNTTQAYVQIIDLSAGAQVRLISDQCDNTGGCGSDFFRVKTASGWADWIRSNTTSPDPGTLFSTTNASFFTDASGPPTRLSLPYMHLTESPSVDDDLTYGVGLVPGDPAYDSPKRVVTFGDEHTAIQQQVQMFDFPTHYSTSDVDSLRPTSCVVNCNFDTTVGFTPGFDGRTGSRRRTYVGVSPNDGSATKVYILDTLGS